MTSHVGQDLDRPAVLYHSLMPAVPPGV